MSPLLYLLTVATPPRVLLSRLVAINSSASGLPYSPQVCLLHGFWIPVWCVPVRYHPHLALNYFVALPVLFGLLGPEKRAMDSCPSSSSFSIILWWVLSTHYLFSVIGRSTCCRLWRLSSCLVHPVTHPRPAPLSSLPPDKIDDNVSHSHPTPSAEEDFERGYLHEWQKGTCAALYFTNSCPCSKLCIVLWSLGALPHIIHPE